MQKLYGLSFLPLLLLSGCGQFAQSHDAIGAPIEGETLVVADFPTSEVNVESLIVESLMKETPLDREGNPANPEAVKIYAECQRNKKEFVGRGSRFDVPGKNYTDAEIAYYLDIPVGCLTR